MWWSLFAVCVALGLVAESYRQLRALRSLRQLAAAQLERRARGDGDARAGVADLNEATIDVRAGLARASIVPKSCIKAALSVGALAAIAESAGLVNGMQHAAPASWSWGPIASLLGGCVGALGCAYLGRAAEVEGRRLRADWGTLIQRSARDVANQTTGASGGAARAR
jgi:hypothetical protein